MTQRSGQVQARPDACRGCPADNLPGTQGFVRPSGPTDARLVLCGQNPGEDEIAMGEGFVGPSGRHLNKWLAKAGIPREKCAVMNIVWCRTTKPGPHGGLKNRTPSAAEIAYCWKTHTEPHLRSLTNKRVIAAIGVPAAQRFIPGAKQKTVGAVVPTEHGYVVPVVHPSAIIQGQWAHDPAQPRYLRRAWDIAIAEQPPSLPDVTMPPPGGQIAHTVHDVAAFLGDVLLRPPPFLYTDIEGVGGILIGIGFWMLDDEMRPTGAGMYVPFRDRAAPYWPSEEDTRCAAEWVDRVLASPAVPKVLQNGSSFDLPFLEEIGFVVNNYADDTMVRAWATYHESAKDLQSLGILYAGLPAWKHTSHVGEEGDGK